MAMPLAIHRFTVDEYHRMAEVGIFHEDDRVELLDGQIVEMSPINPRHAACVDRLNRGLSRLAGDRAIVRVQSPIVLGHYAAPQPDLAVLRPPIERYAEAHPGPPDVMLVIEVADTSVAYDRHTKMPLYARAGILESWLVNLPDAVIEVHSDPGPHGYRTVRRVGRGETLEPSMLPGVEIAADAILG